MVARRNVVRSEYMNTSELQPFVHVDACLRRYNASLPTLIEHRAHATGYRREGGGGRDRVYCRSVVVLNVVVTHTIHLPASWGRSDSQAGYSYYSGGGKGFLWQGVSYRNLLSHMGRNSVGRDRCMIHTAVRSVIIMTHRIHSPVKDQRVYDGEDVLLPQVDLGEALAADEDRNLPQGCIALLLDVGKAGLPQHLNELGIKLMGHPRGRVGLSFSSTSKRSLGKPW